MRQMLYFYPEGHQAHFKEGHQERPERLEAMVAGLKTAGWWDDAPKLSPEPVSLDILYAVHHPDYLERLQEACRHGFSLDADTYTTPASWNLALQAAGGAIALAKAVWKNNQAESAVQVSGFAFTRPPGHHAGPAYGMGFCLLNNIAIAAEYLCQKQTAQRVAIVDLDLHHGNGTQDIFWRRKDVFFLSIHQSPLYPGTGQIDEIGAGPGIGYTANFPVPPGTGDQGYQAIMASFILPLLDRFSPEIILVSAGFDPHWRDPLGHLQLSAAGYGNLIANLTDWADRHCLGRIAFFMEGGYDLDASTACIQALVAAVCKIPWQDPLGPTPLFEGKSWQIVARQAKEIWKL